jgi:hypothetical protein
VSAMDDAVLALRMAALLQEWIERLGGCRDCLHAGGVGRDCGVCGGHMEDEEEADLDPGHTADCIQLRTCMTLSGQPQREARAA